jgi:hypothetical protein
MAVHWVRVEQGKCRVYWFGNLSEFEGNAKHPWLTTADQNAFKEELLTRKTQTRHGVPVLEFFRNQVTFPAIRVGVNIVNFGKFNGFTDTVWLTTSNSTISNSTK